MITNEGFKYLIQAPNAATKLKEILVGNDKDSIVDLNPPKSITSLQSIVTNSSLKYNINQVTYNYLDFHLGLTHQYSVKAVATTRPSVLYEYGIFGDNDKLLYYAIYTNSNKTFLTPAENLYDGSYFTTQISLSNPIKHAKKTISLLSEGVLTDYTVNYQETPFRGNPSMGSPTPMECFFYSSGDSLTLTGGVSLESFDLETREALIRLEVTLDRSKITAGNYILFRSLFCSLKIYLTDPVTEEPVDWPLTDGEALIVPLKVYIGGAK